MKNILWVDGWYPRDVVITSSLPVLAVLQLNGVNLDHSILEYIPELQDDSEDAITSTRWEDVTIRALMSHMFGITTNTVFDLTLLRDGPWIEKGLPKLSEGDGLTCACLRQWTTQGLYTLTALTLPIYISIEGLRSSLNIKSQQPVLFPGTHCSNLILPLPSQEYAEPATRQTPTDQEIIDVLESLKVWGAIQQFGSLDTETEKLPRSIGQQQLVCLARAILRKMESNILILDEAMSAVDGVTEAVMVEDLEREFAAHTILSVVHRLNTVKKYDVLVVLDSGRIIDLGSPKDLVDGNGRLLRETAMT